MLRRGEGVDSWDPEKSARRAVDVEGYGGGTRCRENQFGVRGVAGDEVESFNLLSATRQSMITGLTPTMQYPRGPRVQRRNKEVIASNE